jgi:hypothetical protein
VLGNAKISIFLRNESKIRNFQKKKFWAKRKKKKKKWQQISNQKFQSSEYDRVGRVRGNKLIFNFGLMYMHSWVNLCVKYVITLPLPFEPGEIYILAIRQWRSLYIKFGLYNLLNFSISVLLKSDMIRGVTFGKSDLIRGGLLYYTLIGYFTFWPDKRSDFW